MVIVALLSFIIGFLTCLIIGRHVWIRAIRNPGFWEGLFRTAYAQIGIHNVVFRTVFKVLDDNNFEGPLQ